MIATTDVLMMRLSYRYICRAPLLSRTPIVRYLTFFVRYLTPYPKTQGRIQDLKKKGAQVARVGVRPLPHPSGSAPEIHSNLTPCGKISGILY